MNTASVHGAKLAFYEKLLRVRPAQLADWLKKLFRVQRREVTATTGHRFDVDPASVFGINLLKGETYEPGLTRVVQRLLREGDTFLDLGGNEGYFSVLASACVGSGQVFCIEPQRRLQQVIQKNFNLNACRNVRIQQTAISDTNDDVTLYLRPSLNTGASEYLPALAARYKVRDRSVAHP